MTQETVTLKSREQKKVLKVAQEQNVKIKHFCNRGFCGRCKIKVLEGNVSEPNSREVKKLGETAIKEGYRLACLAEFSGEIKFNK